MNSHEYTHEYYLKHREHILKRCKDYREKNRDKIHAYMKIWRKNNGVVYNRVYRANKFGVSYPTWWLCDICSKPISVWKGEIYLDHNHATGKFRGWLCNQCNAGIGDFYDSPSKLWRAANYLEERNI